MVSLDYIKKGSRLKCENCQTTATAQGNFLPKGWFIVLDSSNQGLLFCRMHCILYYLNKKLDKPVEQVVEKMVRF